MRTPTQIETDRAKPGMRTRTGPQLSTDTQNRQLAGGAGTAPADEFVEWTGSTPAVVKVIRFDQDPATRGFGVGGFA